MADSLIANLSNTSSTGSIFCKYREPESDTEKIAKRTFFALFFLLGIAFNIFVIIITVKCTSRKNLHYLIINMAVSDAMCLFVQLILRNIPYLSDGKWSIHPSGTLGAIVCKTDEFLYNLTYPVSLITLLVISIERYRATRQRLRIARPYTLTKLVALLAFCWLTPMPMAACVSSLTTVSKSGGYCTWSFSEYSALNSFIAICDFLLSLLFLTIFFLSIVTIRRLSKRQAINAHLSEQQRNLRTSRTRAAVKMVLVSISLYIICWLPTFISNSLILLHYFMESITIIDHSACIDWRSFSFFMFGILPTLNSMFSPWIYVIMLPDIRESAKKVLCCGERLNQEPNIRNAAIEMQEMRRPLAGPNRERNAEDIQELSET